MAESSCGAHAAPHAAGTLYIIASVNHTSREHAHISFWGPESRGYILALAEGRVGTYTADEVNKGGLNDGRDCIAIPFDEVMALRTPTPFFKLRNGRVCRFYDVEGPVVDNTRANWDHLIAVSLPRPAGAKPKPQVFRGKKRSFTLESTTQGLSGDPQVEASAEDAEQEAPRG
jgi:hypothetical protein